MFVIKTLIELFDSCQIENVIAGLAFLPEKIVFVGFKEVMTKKRISDLERFFELRGLDICLEYEIVGRYDYDFIFKKLNFILDCNEDCCFDLTGGKELVLTAMGAISAIRNVPMLQFNVRSGNLIRVKNCDCVLQPPDTSMLIRESVVLNGGEIVYDAKDEFDWTLTDDFKKDIITIWNICRPNCGLWNRQSNVFDSFERFGSFESPLSVRVNLSRMSASGHDTFLHTPTINKLISCGMILDYSIESDILSFRYKNLQVRRCLTKAGNILELYTYMTARRILEDKPGFYSDADIGIFVDWDGVIHADSDAVRDTRNEVDVIIMRGLVPVYISCKNGEVRKEALYELSTVAERFGGEYAKKILLTTYVSTDVKSRQHLLQRARDMNIDVIEGVDKMSAAEFAETLYKRAR